MATKRINELTQTASQADLKAGRYGVLDTPNGTMRLPGNLIASGGGGGGSVVASAIFATVADMAADEDIVEGQVVQTGGYYSAGDEGGCLYKVVSFGVDANGMDIIALAGGLFAVAILGGEAYPEQIGYYKDYNYTLDLTPYLTRLSSLGVAKILLTRCGSAPYCMKTTWNCGRPQIVCGANNIRSGYASRIVWRPSGSDKAMFHPTHQGFELHHIVLQYTLTDNYDDTVCVLLDNTNSLMCQHIYEDLAIQKFAYGFKKTSVNLIWHFKFREVFFANNYIGMYLYGLVYVTSFINCYFSGQRLYDIQLPGEPFTLFFDSCNFSVQSPMETIFKLTPHYQPGVPTRFGNIEFRACNFELEGSTLPTNNHHLFFDVDDEMEINLDFLGCFFIYTPLGRNNIFSDRLVHLGSKSGASFKDCMGATFDVHTTDNFYMLDFDKFFFDENSTPRKSVGSVSIENCHGIRRQEYSSIYLPCEKRPIPVCDSSTKVLSNYDVKDGTIFQNLDDGKLYVKQGHGVSVVMNSPGNLVRIGNDLYSFTTINGLYFLTENLKWRTMDSRNYEYLDHTNFGVYYAQSDISKIEAILPAGWRIPTTADITTLLGTSGHGGADLAHSFQDKNYTSVWPGATNSKNACIVPSYYWKAPDQSVTFNTAMLFVKSQTSGEIHNLTVQANDIFRGGWTTSEGSNLKLPVRLVKDA